MRADHVAFGLLVAPTFSFKNWEIDVPLNIGTMGAGFYFTGDDRITPDGDRVSVWEDQLMDGRDAGFGNWFEFGLGAFAPTPNNHIQIGAGLHYTIVQG